VSEQATPSENADDYPWLAANRRRRRKRWLWIGVGVVLIGVVVAGMNVNDRPLGDAGLAMPDSVAGLSRTSDSRVLESGDQVAQRLRYENPTAAFGVNVYGEPASANGYLVLVRIDGASAAASMEEFLRRATDEPITDDPSESTDFQSVPAPAPQTGDGVCVLRDPKGSHMIVCFVRTGSVLTVVELPHRSMADAVPLFNRIRLELEA
jgi:hypothetical protein